MVYIGSNDVALLAKVLRFAYYVVASVADGGNKCCSLLIAHNLHDVAHSHRVGAANAFKSEVALNLAVYSLVVVRTYGVPAASVLYY